MPEPGALARREAFPPARGAEPRFPGDPAKRDPRTRHIPVHVLSVSDFSQMALERGAVGYALKPVKREELVEAFQKLEAKLAQSIRRVLVVEDDVRQRNSVTQLLAADGVEISGETTIKRLDYGVGQGDWKSTEWVGDEVKLRYRVPLTRAK